MEKKRIVLDTGLVKLPGITPEVYRGVVGDQDNDEDDVDYFKDKVEALEQENTLLLRQYEYDRAEIVALREQNEHLQKTLLNITSKFKSCEECSLAKLFAENIERMNSILDIADAGVPLVRAQRTVGDNRKREDVSDEVLIAAYETSGGHITKDMCETFNMSWPGIRKRLEKLGVL